MGRNVDQQAWGPPFLTLFLHRDAEESKAELTLLEILVSLPTTVLFGVQLLGAGGRLSGFIPDGAGYLAFAAVAAGVVRLVVNVSLKEPFGSLFLAPLGLRLRKEAREDVMGDEFAPYGDSLEVRSPLAGGVIEICRLTRVLQFFASGRGYDLPALVLNSQVLSP